MEMEKKKNSLEDNSIKTLWVLLSALGLLIIVGVAGVFFFSPDKNQGEIKPALAATTALPAESPEEFDPIEWARKSEEYPELQEENPEEEDFIVELVTEDEIPVEKPEPVAAPVEKPAPVESESESVYKDVKVTVYWIQVGSYTTMTKAETVSTYLKDKGVNSTIQVKAIDGATRYRVRIGAFNSKAEADKFNTQVRSLDGYEQSYVVQSTVTKQIEVN